MRRFTDVLLVLAALVVPVGARAQTGGSAPVVQVSVSRTIQAVTYRDGERTRVDFRGTELMPRAEGTARVRAEGGRTAIDASFENLVPPTTLGPYLTYVLWTVSPEGRTGNLGELIPDGRKAEISVTTRLTSFGLIVTAEPYFSVSVPSEVVVLENLIREDTKGTAAPVTARYELFQRGHYASLNAPEIPPNDETPRELYQARAAVTVARAAQAERYAPESWSKVKQLMDRAETYATSKARKERDQVPSLAREAVQAAEDARSVAEKRAAVEKTEAEKRAVAEKTEADRRAAAKEMDVERRVAAEAAARAKAEMDAEAARRAAAEQEAAQAQQAAAQAREAAASADAARAAAVAAEERAKADAAAARMSAEQLRAQLLQQFSQVLPTQDTPRGLVVNLGGVNFATGRADLSAPAREKLARLSGIVASHPGLRLEIEGHTDNVGNPDSNLKLSERRADSVREYLVSQGLPAEVLVAKGLGDRVPVADNAIAEGRAKNRRVEIIVSGEVIGTRIGG